MSDSGEVERDLKELLLAAAENLSAPRAEAPCRAIIATIWHDPKLAAELPQRLLDPLLEVTKERLRSA